MGIADLETRLHRQPETASGPDTRPQPTTTPGVPITVLTTDAELCEAIRAAAMDLYPVFIATRLEEAEAFAANGRCAILITDQALSQPALGRIARHLHAYDPAIVTIAVGNRGDDNALIGLLSSAIVERFMLKPVTPALARIVIKSAAGEYQSVKARARGETHAREHAARKVEPVVAKTDTRPLKPAPTSETQEHPAQPESQETKYQLQPVPMPLVSSEPFVVPSAAIEVHPQLTLPKPSWMAVVAAAVIVGVVVWWTMYQRLPDIDPRQVIATNLTAAQQALESGRYVEPPERSALHYYSTVLALDPANADAKRGIDQVADRMIEDVKNLIVGGRLAEAGIGLERVRRVRPEHPRLAAVDTQLRKEQGNLLLLLQARQSAPPIETPQAKVQIAKKSTPTPNATRKQAVAAPVLADAAPPADASKFMQRSPQEADAPLTPGAETAAAASQTSGGATSSVPTASESGGAGATVAPTESVVAVAVPPVAAPAPPKLVKFVKPEYPGEARMRGLEGWVDLTLAVTASGQVADARVASSEKGRLFERSALAAVRKWKYEPRALADPNAMQSVQVRVQFKLEE